MKINEIAKKLKEVVNGMSEQELNEGVTLWGLPPTYNLTYNATASDDAKTTELDKLAQEVKICKKCPLGKTRIQAVFGVGNKNAGILFIGEGPGYDEDRKGEPFVGRAGQLLDKILNSINLSRQTIYIANIVKCHPMINPDEPDKRGNDRPPTPEEVSACLPYLIAQIELIKPKFICTLGNVAARILLNTEQGITRIRGQFFELNHPGLTHSVKVLPTYHPAALLRNPNLKKYVWEDMKKLRDSYSSLSDTAG